MEARRIVRRGPHPVRIRKLQVKEVVDLTRRYRRIILGGSDLEGFVSDAPDDHVKLFFPDADGGESMRDFTPRAFDAKKRELTIDFALHGAGIANAWATNAAPGAVLGVGGPRGSMIVPYDFDWYVLAGDETALPAIARRLEELPAGARTTVLIEVEDAVDEQPLHTAADARITWLHRRGRPALEAALRSLEWPKGDGFVFAAGESAAIRAIRGHLAERGHSSDAQRVSAYWKQGAVAFHE